MLRKALATLILCCTITTAWCTKPSILIISCTKGFGGAEVHALALHQKLVENGYNSHFAVTKGTPLEERAAEAKLPYHAIDRLSAKDLISLCTQHQIDIIHCNTEKEVRVTKEVVKKHPARIVYTRHVQTSLKRAKSCNVDAVVCVSSAIQEKLQKVATKNKYPTMIQRIPPFYFPQKFATFRTTQTKKEFFEQNFSLTLRDCPLLCVIANFWRSKNHALLFKALKKLIHKKGKIVELVLAGTGRRKQSLERLAKRLKIESYVHFLGFTDKVPEILFHADLNVLPSKNEGLGIALLEASLIKTPSIVAGGSGMADVIQHNITGFVFQNNRMHDLIAKIEMALADPVHAKTLATNAHDLVLQEFDMDTNLEKHCRLYDSIV